MLAYGSIEEGNGLVQLELTDGLEMGFAGETQQALGLLHVIHCLLGDVRITLVRSQ
ncbi:MAG: hypothetical protein MRJ92_13480 [Nitrospira sp.]|nr:hypothetical protein [Nitrospira sp.]